MDEHIDCDHQDFEKEPLGFPDALHRHDWALLHDGVRPEKLFVWQYFVQLQQPRSECA